MEDTYQDEVSFMNNRKINNSNRLYVDRNLRKEYITFYGYKKYKNEFKANLVRRDDRIGTLLCNFLNSNFEDIETVKNFTQEYSLSLLSEATKIQLKEVYAINEYQELLVNLVAKYGATLETIKSDFISDIDYLFNLNQLEELNDLTPLQRFYVLTLSKNKSKALNHFQNNKLTLDLGDLSRLGSSLNIVAEEDAIEIAKVNKDRILPIPYTFESKDICQLLVLVLQEIVCMDKFEIKKCKNCGKYFTPEKRTDELYCNNIYEDGRTCKEIGAFKVKQKLIQEDEYMRLYRNVYQKLLLRTRRNPNSIEIEEEFQDFKEQNRKMREKLSKGKISEEEYVEWLNKK